MPFDIHRAGSLGPFAVLVLCAAPGAAQCQPAKTFPSDGAGGDGFGGAVALSAAGDVALVGAPFRASAAPSLPAVGAVYVLARQPGGTWTEDVVFTPSLVQGGDGLGWSVDLTADGALAVGGAPFRDSGGVPQAGEVYAWRRNGASWDLDGVLTSGDGAFLDWFGSAVAVTPGGDRLVVGAPMTDKSVSFEGAAYVFRRDPTGWVQEARLDPVTGTVSDEFGTTVAVDADGDTVVVGAPGQQSNRGTAFVYVRSGTSWSQEAEIQPVSTNGNDFYGGAAAGVALGPSGDVALVGASHQDIALPETGALYVWRRAGGLWTMVQRLSAPQKQGAEHFGASPRLDASETRLVVGAPERDGLVPDTGSVFVWEEVGGVWTLVVESTSQEPMANGFGARLALDDSGLGALVGAPADDALGRGAGAVYDLWTHGPPATFCTAKMTSAGCFASIAGVGTAGLSVPAAFDVVAVGAPNKKSGLLFYGASGKATLPFLGGILCSQPPIRRTTPSFSGGSPPPVDDCTGAFRIDFNAWVQGGNDPNLGAGSVVTAQWWFRDPADPYLSGLSDAVEFVLCP